MQYDTPPVLDWYHASVQCESGHALVLLLHWNDPPPY